MALRAMPHLHVVRPSDANETLDLVEAYLRDPDPPATALILSRQDVAVMGEPDRRASRAGAARGAYVIREDVDARCTLVGTGSEVAVCLEAHDRLSALGIATRVVAMPCWRCFDEQTLDYRDAVLRRTIPSIAVEAGATLGWTRYVDQAVGIDSFGLSAPGSYVMDYFNIGATSVVELVTDIVAQG